MVETGVARIFKHGRSQAVRLPKEFRFSGDRVRVTRTAEGILLSPMPIDVDALFAEIDKFGDIPFMDGGRNQPLMPEPKDLFD